jgi:hypothetical protein
LWVFFCGQSLYSQCGLKDARGGVESVLGPRAAQVHVAAAATSLPRSPPCLQPPAAGKPASAKAASKQAPKQPAAPAAAAGASALARALVDPPPQRPDGTRQRGGRQTAAQPPASRLSSPVRVPALSAASREC